MGDRSKEIDHTIGKKIKNLRKAKKWTQLQLAEKIGKQDSTVRTWELGRSEPDNATVIKLSQLFGVSADYLLGDSTPEDMLSDFVCSIIDATHEASIDKAGIVTRDYKPDISPVMREKVDSIDLLSGIDYLGILVAIHQLLSAYSSIDVFSNTPEKQAKLHALFAPLIKVIEVFTSPANLKNEPLLDKLSQIVAVASKLTPESIDVLLETAVIRKQKDGGGE